MGSVLEWRGFKFRSGFCPLQSSLPGQTSKLPNQSLFSTSPSRLLEMGQEVARIKCCGCAGAAWFWRLTARPRAAAGSQALLSTGCGARPTAPLRGLLLQGGRTSHWFQGSWVLQQQPHQDWQCNRLGTAKRWGRIKAFLRSRSAQGCSFVSLASPRQ